MGASVRISGVQNDSGQTGKITTRENVCLMTPRLKRTQRRTPDGITKLLHPLQGFALPI
jgi:hypothetical protein